MCMEKRTFKEIADDIIGIWPNIHSSSLPYLHALQVLDTTDPDAVYGKHTARNIVTYFLSVADTFRGAAAECLKKELKELIKE